LSSKNLTCGFLEATRDIYYQMYHALCKYD
jgi:hypothetical protein